MAFDPKRVSRFQFVQQGAKTSFAVFDCLFENGRDLRNEALSARRPVMEAALSRKGILFPSQRLASNGFKAFEQARERGFEGLIAKDESAPYIEGRSRKWLKCKVHKEEEFVIGGYSAPAGDRSHFGALLLGAYQAGKLRYVGKVGTGFTRNSLAALHAIFQPLVRERTPFADPPRDRDVTYLEPKLVAQIAFQEWTADGKLRQPVFLGLRDDKKPEECRMPARG